MGYRQMTVAIIGAAGLATVLAAGAQADDIRAGTELASVENPAVTPDSLLNDPRVVVIPNVDFGRYDTATCLQDATALQDEVMAETGTTRIKFLAYEAEDLCRAGAFDEAKDTLNEADDLLAQATGGETMK